MTKPSGISISLPIIALCFECFVAQSVALERSVLRSICTLYIRSLSHITSHSSPEICSVLMAITVFTLVISKLKVNVRDLIVTILPCCVASCLKFSKHLQLLLLCWPKSIQGILDRLFHSLVSHKSRLNGADLLLGEKGIIS